MIRIHASELEPGQVFKRMYSETLFIAMTSNGRYWDIESYIDEEHIRTTISKDAWVRVYALHEGQEIL